MTTHPDQPKAAPSQPDPDVVGEHLVVDKREWVPGEHPDPHRRRGGRWYLETYFRCVRCADERLSTREFREECPAAGSSG
jgi:hypothetical protein